MHAAMTSTRSCAALLSIALLALSSLAHAQTASGAQPYPWSATDGAQPSATPSHDAPRLELDDPRGNVGLTVLGGAVGLGVSVLMGVIVRQIKFDSCVEDNGGDETDCELGPAIYGGLLTLTLAPWLTSAGVLVGGHLRGGTGGYGWTILGGLAGAIPPLALTVLLSTLEGDGTAAGWMGAIGVPAGFIVGAVLGYRLSADDINASLDIAPDGRSASLSISGTF